MSIIFLEGTSGVGKTTSSNKSFDYVKYLSNNPEFSEKHNNPHLQILYDTHIHLDLIDNLLIFKDQDLKDDIYIDRFFISQFVYYILFKFNGQNVDPENFKFNVDNDVFSKVEICILLKNLTGKFLNLVTKITNKPSTIYWCVSKDVKFTEIAMRSRNGFEIENEKTNNWNIENYIHNQNYLFKKLQSIIGIGKLVEVEKFFNKNL